MNMPLRKLRAEEASATSNREVLRELVGLHAQVLSRMPLVQFFVVLGIGIIIWRVAAPLQFFGWACLTLSAEGWRAAYAATIRRRGHAIDPVRVHRSLVFLAAVSGAAVAVCAALFLPKLSVEDQAMLGLILFIMPAAGVAVANSSRWILGAYTLSMLLPSACIWALIHPSQAVTACGLTMVYCIFLIIVSADGEQLLRRSILIRHERDQMVAELEHSNAEVREAMARAEQSAQARARVLAAASHDLRQPLHALSVYSAILTANPAPETLREVGQNIDQIIRSLGTLLTGLLDLSRLSVGHYVPEKQLFSLDRIVDGICDEFQPTAAAKGLIMRRDLNPVSLMGDSLAAGRITRNLLDNAVKYTERGEIRIQTQAAQDLAVLSVADTGKGIPSSEQSRIFEEFYQLDNPGRDRSLGVGLGLAIVQRLAELIRAKISVKSELGLGTEFRVAFSGLVQSLAHDQPGKEEPTPQSFAAKRVYLVDDEIDILKSMSTLLRLWGGSIETAASPAAAERLFKDSGKPDLLIIDLRLGAEEHGAQFATRLQNVWGMFPVLIMTGETSSEALRDANDRGYTLLQKPIAPEVLRKAMSNLFATERQPECAPLAILDQRSGP